MRVSGWPLVGWTFLAVGGMALVELGLQGMTEEGLGLVLRSTARSSALLFGAAFSASSLRKLHKADWTAWLLRNRRYLGVSFAVSHAVHLAAIAALVRSQDAALDTAAIVGGGLAYLFIAAMTATSFDRSARWLGARPWRVLHTTGAYVIWLVFTFTFAGRPLAAGPGQAPVATLGATLLLAVLGLRVYAKTR